MFRTEEMCELSLLVRQQHIEEVTRAIAREGVLHQVDTSYLSREEDWKAEAWQDRLQQLQGLEQRLLLMMDALQVSREHEASAPEIEGDMDVLRDKLLALERETLPLINRLRAEQARLNEVSALLQRLRPMTDLNLDLSRLRRLTFLYAQIGIVPSANLDRFNASLLHVPHVIMTLGEQGAGTLVALFGSAKDREILERAAHSAYMSPISMPEGYSGTPSAILATLEEEMAEVERQREESMRRMQEMAASWGETLRALLRRVHSDLNLVRAVDRFGQVRDVYLIAGWVPTRKAADVIDVVQRLTHGEVAVDITPAGQAGDLKSIPTTLGNKGFLGAFQGLVTNYSFPAYNELDPTPLVALTFVIMFGLMFGDVGHGLVLTLAGLSALLGWIPQLQSFRGLAPVLLAGGLSAIVFGFLYGSIFGIDNILPAIWLRPLESITSILIATVAFGVVLTLIGFGMNIINGIWARDRRRVLFDRYGLAGVWFYLGLIGVAGAAIASRLPPQGLILAILVPPLVLIMFGEPLNNLISRRRPLIHEGMGIFLVTGLFEILEALIGYLSNSLSFVRLGAFAVAHGGLSSVVFILAGMAGGPTSLFYWIVVALGNLFIVGFEGLIVGIQTLRLEYYELLSKFFKGGGIPYKPLTLSEDNR